MRLLGTIGPLRRVDAPPGSSGRALGGSVRAGQGLDQRQAVGDGGDVSGQHLQVGRRGLAVECLGRRADGGTEAGVIGGCLFQIALDLLDASRLQPGNGGPDALQVGSADRRLAAVDLDAVGVEVPQRVVDLLPLRLDQSALTQV